MGFGDVSRYGPRRAAGAAETMAPAPTPRTDFVATLVAIVAVAAAPATRVDFTGVGVVGSVVASAGLVGSEGEVSVRTGAGVPRTTFDWVLGVPNICTTNVVERP